MRFTTPPTMRVIKKEEKEAQLRDHIAAHIARIATVAPGGKSYAYRLVVRSHESPVVRALAALSHDLAAANIRICAVIALPGAERSPAWPDELNALTECRAARDVRLLDAHEQLWLGDETCWIGDCMRREPAKRDAYECYGIGCRETAAGVSRAFELFWRKGAPAATGQIPAPVEAISAALETAVAALQAAEQTPPIASTRH
ncbi:MAG: hypothetical protein JNM89_17025 [Hyphomicrobiaceae bacterium]|nr:hypothetical protein [Hyphomicrobiaceae bacterium]